MSNYFGRKSEFTPIVYTRYFEHTERPKSPHGHIYFDDDQQETSSTYQTKRDLLFKRLFPSKYADANNNNPNENPIGQATSSGTNIAKNDAAQFLGDFISLSKSNTSTSKREPSLSPEANITLSSSDDDDDDQGFEDQLPTSAHKSIVGNLHSRSNIENVRTILIRELYQRTSDPNTEWLKCKMNIPKGYINPKYHADFQRRYKYEIRKNKMKKTKSTSRKNKTETGYHVNESLAKTSEATNYTNQTVDNDDIIEIKTTKPFSNRSTSNVQDQSRPLPECIVLDSDEDISYTTDHLSGDKTSDQTSTTFFIDRSSTYCQASSKSLSTSNEDYHEEDSKYSQLPSRNTSSPAIIRSIVSKHQRRKKNNTSAMATNSSATPLVSAIDRIIDHMDQSDCKDQAELAEQQNLLIKSMKKRNKKKKKKTKGIDSTID